MRRIRAATGNMGELARVESRDYMKITVFWDITPCSLFELDRKFITMTMKAVRISETSIYFNETTRRYSLDQPFSIFLPWRNP
jgi:hypothetical protein